MLIVRKDGVIYLLIFFKLKCLQQTKRYRRSVLPLRFPFFFHNKRFDYINISSKLHLDIVKNLFPNKLEIDEPPSAVYSLGKTIRNKILNYKVPVSSTGTNEDITYVQHRHGRM